MSNGVARMSRPSAAAAATTARRGQRFGLSDRDADDYYDVVMSSEEEGDASDAEAAPESSAAEPRDDATRLATLASAAKTAPSAAVMKHIGSISYSAELVGVAATAAVAEPVADDEFKLSEAELRSHTERRSALEIALDAAMGAVSVSTSGEAPFRFAAAQDTRITSPAPNAAATPSASHAPQQSESAKRKPVMPLGGIDERDSDDEREFASEPDPLYDDAMDDADEKWVQSNLRDAGAPNGSTDATLCCPCCFVTVCMDCQRHVKYSNQYRARVAMNCRVKKDEILTYGSSAASAAPQDSRGINAMSRRRSNVASAMLGPDEYFAVACSDCGTTVGVYDAHQSYHFFNILPSNC